MIEEKVVDFSHKFIKTTINTITSTERPAFHIKDLCVNKMSHLQAVAICSLQRARVSVSQDSVHEVSLYEAVSFPGNDN